MNWLCNSFAMFLLGNSADVLEGNEDGDSVEAVAEMLGLMLLTSNAALPEHSLFKPELEVKNIDIISLLLLEFIQVQGCYSDCD
jgi:hypothetical protein